MFGRIKSLDQRVLNNISRIHKPALNLIMKSASRAGNLGTIWWLICIPFLVSKDWEWKKTGFNIIVALAFAHLMGEIIIKHIVKRTRPCHYLDDDEQIINRPRFYSFPSGHSTSSFAVVGVTLLRCSPIVFLPVALLATTIAFSRVYLRVHYLTDVVCGMLLGLSCGVISVMFFSTYVV